MESNTLKLLMLLDKEGEVHEERAMRKLRVNKAGLNNTLQNLYKHLMDGRFYNTLYKHNKIIYLSALDMVWLGVAKKGKTFILISNRNNKKKLDTLYNYETYKEGWLYRLIDRLFWVN